MGNNCTCSDCVKQNNSGRTRFKYSCYETKLLKKHVCNNLHFHQILYHGNPLASKLKKKKQLTNVTCWNDM